MMHSPYNWHSADDFLPEKASSHENVVRLEDRRAIRDRLEGKDLDSDLLALSRSLGVYDGDGTEPTMPNLTLIHGGNEGDRLPFFETAKSYSPAFIMGAILTFEAVRRTF